MELCSDVFEAAKNAYMAEAEPLLALDPKLATLEQRAAASGRLLSELEATGGECVFARAPLLRGLLERETERFVRGGPRALCKGSAGTAATSAAASSAPRTSASSRG